MQSFSSYRSAQAKKAALYDLIQTALQCAGNKEQVEIAYQSVDALTNQLLGIFDKGNLQNMPLMELLEGLIACSHNQHGNIPEQKARELDVVAKRLLTRACGCLEQRDYRTAFRIAGSILTTYVPVYATLRNTFYALQSIDAAFKFLRDMADLGI